MDQKQLNKRFHLDEEIRELVLFAHEEYGIEGIKYVQKELDRMITSIGAEELPVKKTSEQTSK